jgi:hypothetical protein
MQLLEMVKRDMHGDSLLYIEVPDAWAFNCKPSHDDIFNSCHLWMFSPETLVRLLTSSGFRVFSLRRARIVRGHHAILLIGGIS